ncbi:zinc finger Ran-binding domain-containing protein 2 isoform X2 [Orussus abietinus]|uniref:zinc finger Ran-binding domain-containing protein 2 isoform X2 n=1 Tax=Orussus abietinus TaxID=222816 RepID=UPI000626A8B6|nr:zinc finger Ran-binding domain-containing protein 2 isoform X2 [Orussus abietinus]
MDPKVDEDSQRSVNDGDWICPETQCGNVNFARRNSCNRCGKERGECPKKKKLGQEIGKAAAEKSRGLFSADDWQCNKCGNVNWARRQQCNMCNAPKFGEVEERTGYGGGYNDRGIVEYKERKDDDDDEYDEFGRRRKKRKIENRSDDDSKDSRYSSTSRTKSRDLDARGPEDGEEEEDEREGRKRKGWHNNAHNISKEENGVANPDEENEEEEEDDDDDSGDLSKYDLCEWDFVAPPKKSSNGDATSSEERRSRNGDDCHDSGTSSQ